MIYLQIFLLSLSAACIIASVQNYRACKKLRKRLEENKKQIEELQVRAAKNLQDAQTHLDFLLLGKIK